MTSQTGRQDQQIVITRSFDMPRQIVFEAWTDPARWRGGGDPTDSTRRPRRS